MYVTYDALIQIGLLLVALIGLVYKIISNKKDKK
ncbi:MAG: putative holin-like toxin [Lachnospiraceae bacterium]|nr:putative holin-like toxin [Lachnospiraceae bacterium]